MAAMDSLQKRLTFEKLGAFAVGGCSRKDTSVLERANAPGSAPHRVAEVAASSFVASLPQVGGPEGVPLVPPRSINSRLGMDMTSIAKSANACSITVYEWVALLRKSLGACFFFFPQRKSGQKTDFLARGPRRKQEKGIRPQCAPSPTSSHPSDGGQQLCSVAARPRCVTAILLSV